MSDRNRTDAHPDSPPEDAERESGRTSIEQVEEPVSPAGSAGEEDGVGGTAGVNKAQDNPTS